MAAAAVIAAMGGCSASSAVSSSGTGTETEMTEETASVSLPQADSIQINETLENSADGEHVIEENGSESSYYNVKIVKTGEASGDEADFYGANSAVFAADGARLYINDVVIDTDGTHANAVFSYGQGTEVTIADSVITTSGNCSGGLMTTGGGTMNAQNLNIHTTGNSSAAIRSDRGGGTVKVTGGRYVTDGTGSPVIYSTADITVSDAEMISTASQGVVVEGKNSVTLNNVTLTADNNTKNSDKSDTYQAVMIYQSMSGDAAEGLASFTMNGGTLTNANGDIFFVNNTVAEITLNGAEIINNGGGIFLRAEAAGWGTAGTNGGQVTLTASSQKINGDMIVDDVSHLNLILNDSSVFTGTINPDGQAGEVYVELNGDAKWVLTDDAYITSLTCSADSIDLNGHTLYVSGTAYEAGTSSEGQLIEAVYSSGNGGPGGMPDGQPPEMPGGENGGPPARPDGEPPARPDGEGGEPPVRPDGEHGEPPAKPE